MAADFALSVERLTEQLSFVSSRSHHARTEKLRVQPRHQQAITPEAGPSVIHGHN